MIIICRINHSHA